MIYLIGIFGLLFFSKITVGWIRFFNDGNVLGCITTQDSNPDYQGCCLL